APPTLTLRGHAGEIVGLDFSADGRRLASAGSDGGVRIWDVRTGQLTGSWRRHKGKIEGVSFNPDGTEVASAGEDGVVRVCDTATGQGRRARPGPGGTLLDQRLRGVAFSPDGQRLAAVGFAGVRVWDA